MDYAKIVLIEELAKLERKQLDDEVNHELIRRRIQEIERMVRRFDELGNLKRYLDKKNQISKSVSCDCGNDDLSYDNDMEWDDLLSWWNHTGNILFG